MSSQKRQELFPQKNLEAEMDKTQLLIERSRALRQLLLSKVESDPSIATLIEKLHPLFDGIETDVIVPPTTDRCNDLPTVDDEKYGMGTDVFEACAYFQAALEDWASLAWFPKT